MELHLWSAYQQGRLLRKRQIGKKKHSIQFREKFKYIFNKYMTKLLSILCTIHLQYMVDDYKREILSGFNLFCEVISNWLSNLFIL